MARHARLDANVPGPFYTTGQCMACGAPEDAAPDLLAPLTDDNWHTYFVRQPESPDELERACHAVEVCCVSALRYGGADPAICAVSESGGVLRPAPAWPDAPSLGEECAMAGSSAGVAPNGKALVALLEVIVGYRTSVPLDIKFEVQQRASSSIALLWGPIIEPFAGLVVELQGNPIEIVLG